MNRLISLQISFAAYHHTIDRMITKMRGSLVALIFNKTLRMSTLAVSDVSAITLMSTDIERIASGLREVQRLTPTSWRLCSSGGC